MLWYTDLLSAAGEFTNSGFLEVTSASGSAISQVSFTRARPAWFTASSSGWVFVQLEGVEVEVGEPGIVGGGELVTRQTQYWRVEERLSRMCCASG